MKTVRDNGTMYIGQIGGKGGEGDQNEGKTKGQGVHSHLSFFPSEAARVKATAWKKAGVAEGRDFNSTVSEWLSDFKKFVTVK